jgi:mono/diheme cytochrome c family protein
MSGQPRIRFVTAHAHLGLLGALGIGALLVPACSSGSSGLGSSTNAINTDPTAHSNDPTEPCAEPAGCIIAANIGVQSTHMDYGQTVGPVAYTNPPKYYAFKFDAVTGDNISISVSAPDGNPYVWLTDSEFGILQFNAGTTTTPAQITATIPSDGSMKHYIVFREQDLNPATFTVTLNGPPNLTYQSTRIAQSDIDNGVYNADQLFAFGHVMFGNTFTLAEGLGNALGPPLAGPNPPPNSRVLQNGKFGGPDAIKCTQCHGVGGSDGAGTVAENLFQDGDGVNLSTELVRNAPALLGDGYIQQLGIEMSEDLQSQLAAAQAAFAAGGVDAGANSGADAGADAGLDASPSGTGPSAAAAQTFPLSSKGVSFGSIAIGPNGVDYSGLDGVDSDLVVKPFGWKGRTAVLRRFVEGGFQVHFGMADQALVATNCGASPIPEVVGNGPDCTDPDSDGVRDEILESQLTSMALYPALLQVPIQLPAATPQAQADVDTGAQLFAQVGCASCHVPTLILNSSIHNESPDLSGGPPFVVDLTVNGKLPRLGQQPDGTVQVQLYSDLKRHDMGASLADSHDSFGVTAANLFLTRPLWGVGATAPYLHDGRAPDLQTAIVEHDGEAVSSRTAFLALPAASQAQIVTFLQALSRDPQHTDD